MEGVIYGPDGRLVTDSSSLEEIRTFDSLIEEYEGTSCSIVPNMLPSISVDSICIESMEGNKIGNEGEDIYQFMPSKLERGSGSAYSEHQKGSVNIKDVGVTRVGLGGGGGGGDIDSREKGTFNPYSQIWMCGHDQRKGLLQIFTYIDGHPGQYVSCTCI